MELKYFLTLLKKEDVIDIESIKNIFYFTSDTPNIILKTILQILNKENIIFFSERFGQVILLVRGEDIINGLDYKFSEHDKKELECALSFISEKKPQTKGLIFEDINSISIHPILDFKEKMYLGVWLPYRNSEKIKEEFCVISENKNIFLKKDIEGTNLNFLFSPNKMPNRWSFNAIRDFLKNKEKKTSIKEIFEKIKEKYKYYIDFGKTDIYDFFALWVLGTYLHPLFQSYPYVYVGGIKETGKSKVLGLSCLIAFNSIFSGNMSTSSIFRLIQNNRCTLFIDETEKLYNQERAEDFRNILLNGYKQGALTYRVEKTRKETFEVKEFNCFSPKILANIRGLEDVLESRCIIINMLRTINKEIGDREIDQNLPDWQALRDEIYFWVFKNWREVKKTYNEMVNETELKNREYELWKPIFTLAKIVGNYEEMKKLAKEKSELARTENLTETGEYVLIECLREIVLEDNFYKLKYIREIMEGKYDSEQKWLTNEWVGRALKRFGLMEKRRVGTGVEIKLNVVDIKKIAEGIGIIKKENIGKKTEISLENFGN